MNIWYATNQPGKSFWAPSLHAPPPLIHIPPSLHPRLCPTDRDFIFQYQVYHAIALYTSHTPGYPILISLPSLAPTPHFHCFNTIYGHFFAPIIFSHHYGPLRMIFGVLISPEYPT